MGNDRTEDFLKGVLERKVLFYKKMQFVSGLYSLLLALDFFESHEFYFHCHCIIEAIKRNSELLKVDFSTRIELTDYSDLPRVKRMNYLDESTKIIERVLKET